MNMLNKVTRIMVFTVLCLVFLPGGSFASIKIFKSGEMPRVLGDKSAGIVLDLDAPDEAMAAQVAELVGSNTSTFGFVGAEGGSFEVSQKTRDNDMASVRLQQKYEGISVEGAEVIAVTDGQGRLESVNSALVEVSGIDVKPAFAREYAVQIAAEAAGIKNPDVGQDRGDGLVIANPENGAPALVWQVSIREAGDWSKAVRVQVVASGSDAGRVIKQVQIGRMVSAASVPVSIYDSSVTVVLPNPVYKGVQVLKNGKKTLPGYILISDEAKSANTSFERVTDFYKNMFGYRSWDGKNVEVVASVNVQRLGFLDLLGLKQNAAWMAPWKFFIFGAGGDELGNFAGALDVVGHEFTHAVISSTSNLAYERQSGALNEHFADVFGASIEYHYNKPAKPFHIGDTVLRGELAKKHEALRDMMNPHNGVAWQPENMREMPYQYKDEHCMPDNSNDNCGVHINCGIPGKAAALAISAVGWEPMYKVFYRVMTARLLARSKFLDYKHQMLEECAKSLRAQDCKAIEGAFEAVGI